MFLIRGLVFTHEAVRDWEAKLAPLLAEGLRKRGLVRPAGAGLALRQGYAQSRDVARITSTHDLQHVDTAARTVDPGFDQAQNQLHPHSPAAETYGRS